MGLDDKIDNEARVVKGAIKEGVGHATHDDDLIVKGKADQASGNLKQAAEKVKDAVKGVVDK